MENQNSSMYLCWLSYKNIKNSIYKEYLKNILLKARSSAIIQSALKELNRALKEAYEE